MTASRIATDIEVMPKPLVGGRMDSMSKAMLMRDMYAGLGSKERPVPLGDGYFTHPDACGIEFATPPCASATEFIEAIRHGQRLVEEHIGCAVVFVDRYDVSEILSPLEALSPAAVRTMMRMGCDPDYEVVNGVPVLREVPRAVANSTIRELGGHLHIDMPEGINKADFTMLVGYHLRQYHHHDASSWYRRPNVYRPKEYGIEYRSLGASWAASSSTIKSVFDSVQTAVEAVR